jgi:hypothetical protein
MNTQSVDNLDFFTAICDIGGYIAHINWELKHKYPTNNIRFSSQFIPCNRKEWPKNNMNIEWEINLNELIEDDYIEVVLGNGYDNWYLSISYCHQVYGQYGSEAKIIHEYLNLEHESLYHVIKYVNYDNFSMLLKEILKDVEERRVTMNSKSVN